LNYVTGSRPIDYEDFKSGAGEGACLLFIGFHFADKQIVIIQETVR
jgi:hypothetical protein